MTSQEIVARWLRKAEEDTGLRYQMVLQALYTATIKGELEWTDHWHLSSEELPAEDDLYLCSNDKEFFLAEWKQVDEPFRNGYRTVGMWELHTLIGPIDKWMRIPVKIKQIAKQTEKSETEHGYRRTY